MAGWTLSAPQTRPIKIIVPFLAGGTVDIVARQIGQQLSALLGQPVVIDNRPGGGTTTFPPN